MPINVFRIYAGRSWAQRDELARLQEMFDAVPGLLYALDSASDVPDDENLRANLRIAMTQTHVALCLADTPDADPALAIEVELARTGFRRRIPIIAVRRPGTTHVNELLQRSADRVVPWDGSTIAYAIQELTEAAFAERRQRTRDDWIMPVQHPSVEIPHRPKPETPRALPFEAIEAAYNQRQGSRTSAQSPKRN